MNIFEIEQEILNCVDSETGEIIDFEKLNELQIAREVKIDSVASWVKQLNAESVAIKEEVTNLQSRQKQKEKKAESLKGYLSLVLNGSKFESSKNVISYRKSKSVDITNESLIPEDYIKEEVVYKYNKTDIKHALECGLQVPGAELIEKQNIQIK